MTLYYDEQGRKNEGEEGGGEVSAARIENECDRNGWEHIWCNCGGGWHCTTCGNLWREEHGRPLTPRRRVAT